MEGIIETSSTLSLCDKDQPPDFFMLYGGKDLETFMKEGFLIAYTNLPGPGVHLVKVGQKKYSIHLDNKCNPILVVDMDSIEYDPGCGEICLAWQPLI